MNKFVEEPGWFGVFTREQAEGAIPNGTPIVKAEYESGDANPIGTKGIVLGSVDLPGMGLAYFVEWETYPKYAVGLRAIKIARSTEQGTMQ